MENCQTLMLVVSFISNIRKKQVKTVCFSQKLFHQRGLLNGSLVRVHWSRSKAVTYDADSISGKTRLKVRVPGLGMIAGDTGLKIRLYVTCLPVAYLRSMVCVKKLAVSSTHKTGCPT